MSQNTIKILLLSLLSITSSVVAKDTILLRNGDILTGDILKETPDYIYFRTSAFGAVSLQTKDVEEVRFQTEEHGEIITQPEEPLTEQVPDLSPNQPKAQPPNTKKTTNERWSGKTGLSLAMRESDKSNASGTTGTDKYETYRFYGDLAWKSNKNKLKWNWTYRYSRDEFEKQDDFLNITQHYTHDFKKNYYATAKTMYQQDYRRTIKHEYLQTAEMGIKWITHPDFELSTSAGGGYHKYDRTNYSTSTNPEEEISIFFEQALSWNIVNSLTLIQKYTHLGDFSNYHFVFTAGLENKLIHDIFLRMEYRLDQDTGVFDDDDEYQDKALLTSLLYKF